MAGKSQAYRRLELELAQAKARIAELEKAQATPQTLRENEERLTLALEVSRTGYWDMDLLDHSAHHSLEHDRIFGYEEPVLNWTYDMFLQHVVPEDRQMVADVVNAARGKPGDWGYECRILRADGVVRWIWVAGRHDLDKDGNARRMAGIVQDITERKVAELTASVRAEEIAIQDKQAEEALRESESRYRRLFEDAVLGIFQSTPEGRIIQVNPAYARMFGYESPEQARALLTDIANQIYVHPDRRPDIVRRILDSHGPVVVENFYKRRDGSTFYGNLHAWAVYDEQGRFSRLEGFIEDITQRKQAEEALRESEEKYRALVETTDTGFVILDLEGRVLDANREYVRLSGHEALKEVLGRNVVEWTARHDVGRNADEVRRCVEQGFVRDLAIDYVDKQGRLTPIEVNATLLQTDPGPRIISLCRDVTERKQAAEQLRTLNATLEQRIEERTALAESRASQLRALALQLIQAEQKERRRIAHILHEHFQQLLVAAKFNVGLLCRHPEHPSAEPLARINEALVEAIGLSRSLTVELCPPVLYDVGLVEALRWLARWMQERHGLQVEIRGSLAAEPAEDLRVMLFHATRELLFNVAKHAGVSAASVEVGSQANHLRIAVADEGTGFDLTCRPLQQDSSAGYGLFSIRERLGQLGGRLEIHTSPGSGTCVVLVVPY